ncbi:MULTISPECIES: hypothetical protein [Pseudomonas]|uniref:Uncharacterized protein n=1 Tax=Pseudomonas hamedanensis TaxID=2745504 RepID=A0A9E6NZ44_9PSED|nr:MULTISPECIES: hypothetical protein [Pseudomonas]MBC3273236.1 hypothetical protein [Pseudomonas sp. SWRI81]QXI16546.1 hypothetical protein HU739_021930 [Pseudomonas hamedanensis]
MSTETMKEKVANASVGQKVTVEYTFKDSAKDASTGQLERRVLSGSLQAKDTSMVTVVSESDVYDVRTILISNMTGFISQ